MRILIVDDSKAMQVIVQRSLVKLNIPNLEIKFAFNGTEGLDLARSWEPELVISDWHMPEMSGLELLDALNREMLGIRVGFVTTETSPERKSEALQKEAAFVINKPFDSQTFISVLAPLIEMMVQTKLKATEQALEQPMESAQPSRIKLPLASSIQKTLTALSQQSVSVLQRPTEALSEHWLPAVVGLFVDHQSKVVRGICVIDLEATSILGGILTGLAQNSINQYIGDRNVPKKIVGSLERVFEVLSATLTDTVHHRDLEFKSMTSINTDMARLEALLSRGNTHRMDIEISVANYGQGKMILIGS
ncbi:response regulator [Reinekea sp.]|jgi:CheY-like chemotaxis protein|uniref:response regulator n=1 Tax=Reinekea sp. TaxID=1970455 RepID=UPI002A819886|nr:response regulator [Reinekea sp.]